MADDAATLFAEPEPVTEPQATPAPEVKAEPAPAPAVTPELDPKDLEMVRVLKGSGISNENLNDIIEAPKALAALRYAIENDPKEFFGMLKRSSPEVYEKFLSVSGDEVIDRWGDKPTPGKAAAKDDPNSEVKLELDVVKEQLKNLKTEQERRDAAAAEAVMQERFKGRVDDLFGQVKDAGLTKAETKALRARLYTELAADPQIVQRASKGNFVDAPIKFKELIDEWAADKKAAVEQAKADREKQAKSAFPSFLSGPEMTVTVPDKTFETWDSTIEGFAKALESVGR